MRELLKVPSNMISRHARLLLALAGLIVSFANQEYNEVREKLSLFEDAVRKSVWLDIELSNALTDFRGISMRFLEAA